VAEKKDMDLLSAAMGGQEALQMLHRMERLKKLMGTPRPAERSVAVKAEGNGEIFARSKREDMITAAIPFLDREYQKGIYVFVRLMEMKRVLGGGALETRERQEEPSDIRRQKMICAIQQYLPEAERSQMETIIKMMTVKELMGREETR